MCTRPTVCRAFVAAVSPTSVARDGRAGFRGPADPGVRPRPPRRDVRRPASVDTDGRGRHGPVEAWSSVWTTLSVGGRTLPCETDGTPVPAPLFGQAAGRGFVAVVFLCARIAAPRRCCARPYGNAEGLQPGAVAALTGGEPSTGGARQQKCHGADGGGGHTHRGQDSDIHVVPSVVCLLCCAVMGRRRASTMCNGRCVGGADS